MKGYSFHWGQAVQRKVWALSDLFNIGLFIEVLTEHIDPTSEKLELHSQLADIKIKELIVHVKKTWTESSL